MVPKFGSNSPNIRKTLIEKHRELYRRSDQMMFTKLVTVDDNILALVSEDFVVSHLTEPAKVEVKQESDHSIREPIE